MNSDRVAEIVCAVGLTGFLILALLNGDGFFVSLEPKRAHTSKPAVRSVAASGPSSRALFEGRRGTLETGSAPWAPLFRTREGLYRFMRSLRTGDKQETAALLLSDEAFIVNRGTSLLVIETALFKARVRVLEGASKGSAGWLPSEFVRPVGR